MKKKYLLLPVFLTVLAPTYAQDHFSSFREIFITEGETAEINGELYSEPDVYKVRKEDGTFEAVRLTVAPRPAVSEMTQPYLNLCTPNSICVNWKTKTKPTSAEVVYGEDKDHLDKSATATNVMLAGRTHCWNTAEISGLQPETDYYYRVNSGDKHSEIYHFRTMPRHEDKRKIRILLLGDHQRNEHSDYEWMLNAARETVKQKYGDGPFENHINFLLNDGDQVDAGLINLYEKVHLFKSRSVSPTLPVMTTVGNHELKQDPLLQIYNKHYSGYGRIDYQGITSGTANYYAYQAGCVLVVSINSDEETDAQKQWIKKVITAAAQDESVEFIVSVQHRPLYAELWNWDVSPWMLNEIMPILSSTPKHVLNYSGHHHLYARGQMTDYPCYHIISGGGVGTSAEGYDQLFGVSPDPLNRDEVQKTIDVWSYQILEFDPVTKTMTAESYSVGNSRRALDNEMIDSFSRSLANGTTLPTPTLDEPATEISLPVTISQTAVPADLLTTQFEISQTEDFTNPYRSILRNVEDFFDVDDEFRPVDQNKGIDISNLTIDNGALPNGVYYVRVRNRNSNLDWSDYSQPVKITVVGEQDLPHATVERRFYSPGDNVKTLYYSAPVGTDAWVGIYESHVTPGNGTESVAYAYTSAPEGSAEFKIEKPGAYYAVLFKDGGYSELGSRGYFIVSDNCDENNPPSISTDKEVYAEGEPVVVSYENATCFHDDWIGIYRKNEVPVNAKSRSYLYVANPEPNGSVTLNVPGTENFSTPIEPGEYFVSYFNCGDYYEPVKRAYFSVAAYSNLPELAEATDIAISVDGHRIKLDSPTPIDNVRIVGFDGKVNFDGNFNGSRNVLIDAKVADGLYIIRINNNLSYKVAING